MGNEVLTIDVDNILAAKAPGLKKVLPNFVVSYLKRLIHQDECNEFIISNKDEDALTYSANIIKKFGAVIDVYGAENIPQSGRFVFASNHPLGGLDGIALITVVSRYFTNLKFPVNDMLLYLKNMNSIFLPVNKVGRTSRRAAELMEEAFASDAQMLMFPAGLCSRKRNGIIADLDWKKGFITKAIQTNRDIIPVHISGQNSNFFYNLSNIRRRLGIKVNIEMLFLVDEMYKQYNQHIDIYFGKPIPCDSLGDKSPVLKAEEIRAISYGLINSEQCNP